MGAAGSKKSKRLLRARSDSSSANHRGVIYRVAPSEVGDSELQGDNVQQLSPVPGKYDVLRLPEKVGPETKVHSPRATQSETAEASGGRWTAMPGEVSELPEEGLPKKVAQIRLVQLDDSDSDEREPEPVPNSAPAEQGKGVVTSYWAKLNPKATHTSSKAVLVPMDEFGNPKPTSKATSGEGPKGILRKGDPHPAVMVSSSEDRTEADKMSDSAGPSVGRSLSEALPGGMPSLLAPKILSEEELIVQQMKLEGLIKSRVTDLAVHRELERQRLLHEVRNMSRERRRPSRLAPLDARLPCVPSVGDEDKTIDSPKGEEKGKNPPNKQSARKVNAETKAYLMDLELA